MYLMWSFTAASNLCLMGDPKTGSLLPRCIRWAISSSAAPNMSNRASGDRPSQPYNYNFTSSITSYLVYSYKIQLPTTTFYLLTTDLRLLPAYIYYTTAVAYHNTTTTTTTSLASLRQP